MQEQLGLILAPNLGDVFKEYMLARQLCKETRRNYRQRMRALEDWKALEITSITPGMVVRRHSEITAKATANAAMRTLRAVLHYARTKYENAEGFPILDSNPVRCIGWHAALDRAKPLEDAELAKVYQAAWQCESVKARDFLMLVLFTGLTGLQVRTLDWKDVDLEYATIYVDGFGYPVSDFVLRLLAVRSFNNSSGYVFEGRFAGEHLKNTSTAFQTIKRRSGVEFTLYDIRATFHDIASELGIEDPLRPDTTTSIARLRRSTQRITNEISRRVE